MKKLLTFLLLIIPLSAQAQNWTAEQQEVLDFIRTCWDAGKVAWDTKNFDHWIEVCPADDFTIWDATAPVPNRLERLKKLISTNYMNSKSEDWLWSDIDPLVIQIHGNVAVVHYHSMMTAIDEAEMVISRRKAVEVFIKEDGRWKALGGMVVQVPNP